MSIETKAYSIQEFCKAHGISRGTFYILLKSGKCPRMMKIGRRRLISHESAANWRHEMEEDQKC